MYYLLCLGKGIDKELAVDVVFFVSMEEAFVVEHVPRFGHHLLHWVNHCLVIAHCAQKGFKRHEILFRLVDIQSIPGTQRCRKVTRTWRKNCVSFFGELRLGFTTKVQVLSKSVVRGRFKFKIAGIFVKLAIERQLVEVGQQQVSRVRLSDNFRKKFPEDNFKAKEVLLKQNAASLTKNPSLLFRICGRDLMERDLKAGCEQRSPIS